MKQVPFLDGCRHLGTQKGSLRSLIVSVTVETQALPVSMSQQSPRSVSPVGRTSNRQKQACASAEQKQASRRLPGWSLAWTNGLAIESGTGGI